MADQNFDNLNELFYNSVNSFGNNRSVSLYQGEKLNYSQLGERVEQIVSVFKECRLQPGDKVALISSNCPNWVASYFAVTISSLVVVPILPDFSDREINAIVEHSDCQAVIASDKYVFKLSDEIKGKLRTIIRVDTLSALPCRCEDKMCQQEEIIDYPKPLGDDLAAIIYTSGTTGTPKGVMLTHKNLCSDLYMVSILQPLVERDIFLSLLPLAHTYECTIGMLYPMMCGASVVYLEKPPTASILVPVLKSVKPTLVLSVPLIIEKIYKNQIVPKFTKSRFVKFIYSIGVFRKLLNRMAGKKLMETFGGRIRFFAIGGAKLDINVEKFLKEARFPYGIGYGLTETAPLIAGVTPGYTRVGSTGPALSGVELKIYKPHRKTGEGEILAKGPNIMQGYYKNPEATANVFTSDGWFKTGDLGIFDDDRYLYIKGRSKNMILGPSGENIYPEEIESVINEHAMVAESLVQEEKGRLVAHIHFKYDEISKEPSEIAQRIEAMKEEIKKYVNDRVNKFSRISAIIEQTSSFEKTPTHKIKRFLYKVGNRTQDKNSQ